MMRFPSFSTSYGPEILLKIYSELIFKLALCFGNQMEKAAVAFIDILGFKGIWKRLEPNKVLEILNGVNKKILEVFITPTPEKGWAGSFNPEVTILSDTIVIVIRSDRPECIFLMPHIINNLSLYFFEHKLFFRGAIGYGDFIQEQSTFIGPVIDDVASWYEEANWIGTILTPKTNYLCDRFDKVTIGVNNIPVIPYIKYLVPGKNGKKFNLNCLNSPAYLQACYKNMAKPGEKNDVRAIFEQMFSQQSEIDVSVLLKYENTLEFIDYSISLM